MTLQRGNRVGRPALPHEPRNQCDNAGKEEPAGSCAAAPAMAPCCTAAPCSTAAATAGAPVARGEEAAAALRLAAASARRRASRSSASCSRLCMAGDRRCGNPARRPRGAGGIRHGGGEDASGAARASSPAMPEAEAEPSATACAAAAALPCKGCWRLSRGPRRRAREACVAARKEACPPSAGTGAAARAELAGVVSPARLADAAGKALLTGNGAAAAVGKAGMGSGSPAAAGTAAMGEREEGA